MAPTNFRFPVSASVSHLSSGADSFSEVVWPLKGSTHLASSADSFSQGLEITVNRYSFSTRLPLFVFTVTVFVSVRMKSLESQTQGQQQKYRYPKCSSPRIVFNGRPYLFCELWYTIEPDTGQKLPNSFSN